MKHFFRLELTPNITVMPIIMARGMVCTKCKQPIPDRIGKFKLCRDCWQRHVMHHLNTGKKRS